MANTRTKTIILASTSPRRKELLRKLGISFRTEPSYYQEDMTLDLAPEKLAEFLSLGKAQAVAKRHKKGIIIASDTFVIQDGEILGKPKDKKDAKRMLRKISGKKHSIITGFTIIDVANNKTLSRSVTGKIYVKKLTEKEINTYIESGEPMGKAGAYAVQGLGAVIVERIEGDFFAIMGLPLFHLAENLKEFGVEIL